MEAGRAARALVDFVIDSALDDPDDAAAAEALILLERARRRIWSMVQPLLWLPTQFRIQSQCQNHCGGRKYLGPLLLGYLRALSCALCERLFEAS